MLAKNIDKIIKEDGVFTGVSSGSEIVKGNFFILMVIAKAVIGDPSYFPDQVKKTGKGL